MSPIALSFLKWLINPHHALPDETRRSTGTLLDRTLLALVVLVGGIILYYVDRGNTLAEPDLLIAAILWSILTVLFILQRAGHILISAYLLVGITLVTTVSLPFIPGSQTNLLYFALLPIFLAGMFLGPRPSAVVGIIVIGASIGLAQIDALAAYLDTSSDPTPIIVYLILITGLYLVLSTHNQTLERIRRRQLETLVASLRDSEANLEQRVTERTRELELASHDAERANQIKSQFMAAMSHELRTPINAILNFTQFVAAGLKGPVTPAQKESLDKAIGATRHLLALVNDVLDITRIEVGSLNLNIDDEVNLTEILHEMRDTAAALVNGKPVAVHLDIAPTLPPLPCDRRRVRQILLNLVSNACKFTAEGQITLRAHADNDHIYLAVADTGPGIPIEDQEAIFNAFQQSSAGLNVGTGTGLGLPIARSLAEAHGGRLWLESQPGYGATFYVTLPLALPA